MSSFFAASRPKLEVVEFRENQRTSILMNLTQKRATLVDRSAGECVLLRSPFVVVDISLRSRGISQIKAAACHYDASWIHLRRLSITSRKTTFATFGSTSCLTPEASDRSYDATATTTTSLATVAPNDEPTKGQCLGQALKSDRNGAWLALDVAGVGVGFLPGGGLVTGSAREAIFCLWCTGWTHGKFVLTSCWLAA